MSAPLDEEEILEGIRERVESGRVRVTTHAIAEAAAENIPIDEGLEVLQSSTARVLENYPTHKRGACCLVGGKTQADRDLHIVCTTATLRLSSSPYTCRFRQSG